ncbi:MAG: nucleotidyltransferase [Nanoarchaeota archaeon]
MVNLKEQESIFKLIGESLKEKTEAFVIGGSAMMYHGAKNVTKDIDLVFSNKKDKEKVEKVLKDLKFTPKSTKLVYIKKKNVPLLLQRDNIKIDLFCKRIICFELSQKMIERVAAVYEFNNLILKIISPEDIIVLKCATERPGDRLDAAELIKNFEINWDIIVDEAVAQGKIGRGIFSVFLYDFLMELKEDFKVEIPKQVLKNLMEISEKAILKARKEGTLVREK